MNLYLKIKTDLREALKKGEKLKLEVLRLLLSSLDYKKIEKRAALDEPEVLAVLRSEEKKRLEAIEAYEKGGFQERAVVERTELGIIRQYLPLMLDEGKIKEVIEKVIAKTGAAGEGDFGKIMKAVMGELKGKADGSRVVSLVRESLEKVTKTKN